MDIRVKRYGTTRVRRIVWSITAAWCAARAVGQTQPAVPAVQRSGEQEVDFNEGLVHLRAQEFGEASESFDSVVKALPDDAEAAYYLGLAEFGDGKFRQAADALARVLAVQPTFAAARISHANAMIQLNRIPEAQADVDVLANDPASRTAAVELRGRIAYAQRDYQKAAEEFQKARADSAGAPPSPVMEGLTYLQLGQVDRVTQAFGQSSALRLDPSLDALSHELQSNAAQVSQTKPWQFSLAVGYEWDSNVVLFDNGVVRPQDIPRKDDGRIVVEPGGSYSLVRTKTVDAGVETSNYLSYQSTLSDFDLASYQIGAYANWQALDRLVLGLRYDFNDIELGHDPYLKRNVVNAQATLFENKFGYTSAYGQFDRRQYDAIAGSGRLDRDGEVYGLGVVQSVNLPAVLHSADPMELQLSGLFQRQQTAGADFSGEFFDAGATLVVPLPWKITADFGAHFDWEEYDHGNSLDADNDRRRDFEMEYTVGLTKKLNESVQLRAEYSYTHHDSNVVTPRDAEGGIAGVNPYEFQRQVVGLQMILTF